MTGDKFNDSLSSLLEQGRINHVLKVMREKCLASLPSHPDMSRVLVGLDRVADTYSHLRRFLLEGHSDPGRDEVISSLKEEIRSLGRDYLFICNENRLDPFFAEYRLRKVRGINLSDLAADLEKNDYRIEMAAKTEADAAPFLKKREELVDSIFLSAWSLPPWDTEGRDVLRNLIRSGSFEVRAQIVSALMLGLLKINDPAKFLLLIEAYEVADDDELLAARALTAIVLVLSRWGKSAVSTPAVKEKVEALENSIMTYTRLRTVVMTLIRTRDTDRVSREVNEAFTSTMKEITPEMLEKLRREGLAVDAAETGMNPEWEKLMKNKDLEEKMMAINDMQLEGMDVMMQTFSRLKSFPFFRTLPHWFIPFSPEHSAVADLFGSFSSEAFRAMAEATEMCAGDRFSFALGILQMPEDRRALLATHFSSQLDAIKDAVKDKHNIRRRSLFDTETLVFARDIYRFAKLYPQRQSFFDPFENPVDFLHTPLLGALLTDDEIITMAADFYFRYGYYPLALSLYEEAVASGKADAAIYEKIGYCCQTASDFRGALAAYEKADLFSTDIDRSSAWLLKKLAFTNKALGNYDAAAGYYRKLLERNPDDLKTEFHLGCVLLRTGDVACGRELISKVRYLDPDHAACERIHTRLKGHDAFNEGDYRRALDLYEEARGNQDADSYRRDLVSELRQLYPLSDTDTLRILLDE